MTAMSLLAEPVAVVEISRREAFDLCVLWEHELGGCDRPFGQDHFALVVNGAPVACAVSASIVSPTVRDEHDREWGRREVLELARIARAPDAPWSLRVMLRLWREVLADRWKHWPPVGMLVAYALPGRTGNLYRFDGWTFVRWVKPSRPGSTSTWSKASASDSIADGPQGPVGVPPRGRRVSSARLLIGDVHERLAELEPGSVDLVMSSPPFLALRSYLPDDHPDKAKEIGSEPTPGEFIDAMLDVVEGCARVLAPHGSLVFELGDTYAGSGGAGGDYNEAGMREGQPKFSGSALSYRKSAQRNRAGGGRRPDPAGYSGRQRPSPKSMSAVASADAAPPDRLRTRRQLDGWPLDKSKVLIPQLFAIALAYGFNPLTGRETDLWRVRNTVAWCRPNPPVGRDGDKFRAATSILTVVTRAADRYWDTVRVPSGENTHARTAKGVDRRENTGKSVAPGRGGGWASLDVEHEGDGTRPLYDWWEIPTAPYKGSHYATYPRELVVPVVKSMCPQRVCRTCGEPSRRLVERESTGQNTRKHRAWADDERQVGAVASGDVPEHSSARTLGWSDCGHDDWRPGVVLDPFAGSGTTLAVATGHGLDAIGIDLDERNAELARERIGMFLTVELGRSAA